MRWFGEGLGLPFQLAGGRVQRRNRSLAAAGSAINHAILNQDRLGITPLRHLPAETLHGFVPKLPPGLEVRRDESSPTAHRVNAVLNNRWRPARSIPKAVLENRRHLGRPNILAVSNVNRDE